MKMIKVVLLVEWIQLALNIKLKEELHIQLQNIVIILLFIVQPKERISRKIIKKKRTKKEKERKTVTMMVLMVRLNRKSGLIV